MLSDEVGGGGERGFVVVDVVVVVLLLLLLLLSTLAVSRSFSQFLAVFLVETNPQMLFVRAVLAIRWRV